MGKPGQTVTLKATVKAGVIPVVGATVTFKVDAGLVGTATTDATGLATKPFVVPEGVGAHTITADFGGDGTYNASTGFSTLTVSLAATKITADVLTRTPGSVVAFGAKLTRTTDLAALAGKTLNFYDSTGTVFKGSGVTDATGRATINVTVPAHGVTVKYMIKFATDANYTASSATGSVKGA